MYLQLTKTLLKFDTPFYVCLPGEKTMANQGSRLSYEPTIEFRHRKHTRAKPDKQNLFLLSFEGLPVIVI